MADQENAPSYLPTSLGDFMRLVQAWAAAEDERRRQLHGRAHESVKSLARWAAGKVGEQFTPTPQMAEVGEQLKGMTNGGPVYGPVARFGVDSFVDATTPGGALTNLDLPIAPLAKGIGLAAMMHGGLKIVKGAETAGKVIEETAPDIFALAKKLYFERGHGGRQSVVGMAQALKDAGYKFGPMKNAAEKQAANAFVQKLIGEAETASRMVPESPFAGPATTPPLAAKVAETAAPAAGGWLEEIRTLFPRLDKYGKPAGRLTGATVTKRLEAAAELLSPEAKTRLTELAATVGDRRIAADELHALAEGKVYTPDRVLRKVKAPVEGAKQIPGAPLGVTNARQERAARERYLQRMAEGVEGRDWYRDAGGAIHFYANEDPTRAMQLAEDIAITSPATTVGANTGFGVKGYNQATAGVPIAAGRFPTAMGERIAEVHAEGGGVTGLKRTPFAQNMARGGGFLPPSEVAARPVNDIWQGEAFGFVNPDGTPIRTGFTAAQHRWMDTQTEKILAEANKRGVGGHSDWDVERAQAAAWVAAKVRAGEIKPADAAKSYANYFGDLAAQGSRETIPGETTQHLPELFEPGADPYRQILHDMVTSESGIYDPQMRDQIAAGYGGLVGRGFEGPGVFQGAVSPGLQTQVLTGSLERPGGPSGARVLDEGSRRILDATEATYGLLTGQDAAAYSRILPAGSGVPRNAWDVTLPGGTVTRAQMQALVDRLGPGVREMALIPTPDGIRLALMDEATMKGAVKALGGKVKTAGILEGSYLPNDWRTQRVGQGYFEQIRRMGTEKFDAVAPALAARLRDIDARFVKEAGGRFTLSPMMDEVRAAVAGEGFAGLERLAKKYGMPVTVLAAGLAALQASGPGSGSAAGTAPATSAGVR